MQYVTKWRILLFSIMVIYHNTVCSTSQVIDKIIAIVNNDIILLSDVHHMLNGIKCSSPDTYQKLINDIALKNNIINQLIINNIILQFANNVNIIIDDNQINDAINSILTEHNITSCKLQTCLSNNNIKYDIYRKQIRQELLIAALCNNEISHRINISPQEVNSLAKILISKSKQNTEFNISHIFIPISEKASLQQIKNAKKLSYLLLKKSYHNNVNFDKLAMFYAPKFNTLKVGRMGWGTLEEFPSLFAKYLHNVKKGSIIGPIRSDVGFHILKVNDIHHNLQTEKTTEVHIRHILLHDLSDTANKSVYYELQNVTKQIYANKLNFSMVAKQISEDPISANNGGDLGWCLIDTLEPVLSTIIMHMKKGEISRPFYSNGNWQIIQLLDIHQIDYTENMQKYRAYRLLFNRKFNEEVPNWIQEKQNSTYIKIFDTNE